ncbi:MAG: RluA family pseudouridine synthase [Acidimicrobiales bacterium]
MTERSETIPPALAGERVDRVVAMIAELSRSEVARIIAAGGVQVDGTTVTSGSSRLSAGQQLRVVFEPAVDDLPGPDPDVDVEVVYSDPDVVVVDKPAGLLVHPGAGEPQRTLVHGLLAIHPEIAGVGEPRRPGIVHRLDRGTSGLLVVARTARAHAALVEQMSRREPHRAYTALCWGHPTAGAGTIDAPIGRSVRHRTRMAVTERGRPAVTRYRVERRFARPREVALLTCELETGRTHQIRVHLRAIGHPIVGDRDYGGARPGLDPGRPFLHAGELAFRHPVTGQRLELRSPLPRDLMSILEKCR